MRAAAATGEGFLQKTAAQLKEEQAAARKAADAVHGHEACLKQLGREIDDRAVPYEAQTASAAKAAADVAQAAAEGLAELQARSASRLAELSCRLEAEAEVCGRARATTHARAQSTHYSPLCMCARAAESAR